MKIEVWSDFICPYCYIGKKQLEQALAQFSHASEVKIEYKSFQLDPEALHLPGKSYQETMSEKKGLTLEEFSRLSEQLIEKAKTVGLQYTFDQVKYTNTFDAHRLLKFGETKGLGQEVVERILAAYFTEAALLSDYPTLLAIAKDVGMDEDEVMDVLTMGKFKRKVSEDIDVAKEMGVEHLPFFVFNEKYALSGSQPESVLLQALKTVWEETADGTETTNKADVTTTYCVGDECEYEER